MKQDSIWERGIGALIEKGQLITQTSGALAPGQSWPHTDNGAPCEPAVPFPNLAHEGFRSLGRCSRVPALPTPIHMYGDFDPGVGDGSPRLWHSWLAGTL